MAGRAGLSKVKNHNPGVEATVGTDFLEGERDSTGRRGWAEARVK